jgi:hypothetical protein
MKEYLVLTPIRCRLKYVMMYSLPSVICVKTAPITASLAIIYNRNGILAIGAFIIGGEDKYFLMSSKACC